MATRPSISAKATAKQLRRRIGPTFIQRSRSESSEQKAIWHQVTGAGRSGVRREFFGLADDEQGQVKAGIETLLQARIAGKGA